MSVKSNPNGNVPEIVESNEKTVMTAGGDAWIVCPSDMAVSVEEWC